MTHFLNRFGKKGLRKPGKLKTILNLQKDPEDKRDFAVSTTLTTDPLSIPQRLSIRQFASGIKNQGNIGSCQSHAGTNAVELLYRKDRKDDLGLSELYLYYKVRELENTLPKDKGACLRTVCQEMTDNGVCLEQYDPYITSKFNDKPSFWADFCARYFRTKSYHRCQSITDMKVAIAEGYPVILGIFVDNAFCLDRTGYPKTPIDVQHCIGGHAVLITGYDDKIGCFEIENSWGQNWGNAGYAFINYEWAQKLLIDAWVVMIR